MFKIKFQFVCHNFYIPLYLIYKYINLKKRHFFLFQTETFVVLK